jgi:hypothetical protein
MNTFDELKSRHRVAQSAIELPLYYESVVIKLQTSKMHLENVLSITEWDISAASNSSGATGSTISTTHVSAPTFGISGNLNNFFGNLFSALDIFAQVVNLVYLMPPLNEGSVSFDGIIDEMRRASRVQNEAITRYLVSMRRNQWHKDLRPFRHCETHRKVIQFKLAMEYEPMQTSSLPKVLTIILPDDPYLSKPTYQKNRQMRTFGISVFQHTLTAIDDMYGIMQAKIRSADRIPV